MGFPYVGTMFLYFVVHFVHNYRGEWKERLFLKCDKEKRCKGKAEKSTYTVNVPTGFFLQMNGLGLGHSLEFLNGLPYYLLTFSYYFSKRVNITRGKRNNKKKSQTSFISWQNVTVQTPPSPVWVHKPPPQNDWQLFSFSTAKIYYIITRFLIN